jgi:hypothetical protein
MFGIHGIPGISREVVIKWILESVTSAANSSIACNLKQNALVLTT